MHLTQWASPSGPYYEKAMMCRGLENTIYFASVNYALRFPESATALISPAGECLAYLSYGEEGVLVHEINLDDATGILAERFAPERYAEES
jgi:predicted amidohydrolase